MSSQLLGSDFVPPISAQPRRSLFGGPSSDVAQPSSPPAPVRQSLFGGPVSQDDFKNSINADEPMDEEDDDPETEFDMPMKERPLQTHYDSDGDSFHGSGDDQKAQMRRHSRPSPMAASSPPQNTGPIEPVYYTVDRGLDLRPGARRPNIFTGHSSTWRKYNADDIGAYEAALNIRSRDLAAHLYNAHAIRRRTRVTSKKSYADDDFRFSVPRRWTAWPLPAADVPRLDDIIKDKLDSGNLRMESDLRPSADLEESILAVMSKTARERYRAREWDYDGVNSKKLLDGDEIMQDQILQKEEEDLNAEPMNTISFEPIIQLDDDKSAEQLRPLTRNILTQLDRLLTGLHYSMKGRMLEDLSEDEQTSDIDDEDRPRQSRSRSRGRKITQKSPGKQSPHRSLSVQMSSVADTDDESLPDAPRPRDQSRASHASQDQEQGSFVKGRLKLRDWSEVMGLASMMGFPSDVVMRTSKRCADLFGEDLEFRTLPEGHIRKKQKANGQEDYVYTESESESESDTDHDVAPPIPQPLADSTPKTKANTKAIPKTKPTPKPKSKPQPKASSSRRKQHKTPAMVPSSSPSASPEPSNAPSRNSSRAPSISLSRATSVNREQATDRESRPVRPGVGKGPHRKADILCPYKDCPRRSNGFSRKWNLNQHMKKSHGVTVRDTSHQRGVSGPEDDLAIMID
ncbi:uncharacterized protein N7511_009573 [Penicillium nucicola]|uniref:uncharacterized protein n=1 Tax=Penicillium nucicola TaxID=1850975 RepID=UPI002545305F|nr:uncharacterized protein N7511_009573 [Penicillium nucicola]KAJ5747877.1 hypothetical protein N7511_009573 [Penicillium nucicola]